MLPLEHLCISLPVSSLICSDILDSLVLNPSGFLSLPLRHSPREIDRSSDAPPFLHILDRQTGDCMYARMYAYSVVICDLFDVAPTAGDRFYALKKLVVAHLAWRGEKMS